MIADLKNVIGIVNRMQDLPGQREPMAPLVAELRVPLNNLFSFNDILCCLVMDLQETGNPEVKELLQKYGIEVKKDENFQAIYERVQARLNPEPARVE